MNSEIEDNPHGTLTINRLIAWVIVGVVMWAVVIQAAMFVWEIV